jgi:hypothetical protein
MSAEGALPELASARPLAADAPRAQPCANCGNPVTQRYCGACGQTLDSPVHSVWQFTREATEDLTHADSRLLRTLHALLLRPGQLTAEFLAGRRVRYLPPLRLYLVVSVLFFLVASSVQTRLAVLELDSANRTDYKVVPLDEQRELQRAQGETAEQRLDRLCGDMQYSGPGEGWIGPHLNAACHKAMADNFHSLQEAFFHNLPRAMFLFMPLLATLMTLLYWRPRRYYIEHLLLCVHNHACAFLVFTLLLLLSHFGPRIPGLGWLVFGYFAWYLYRSMRVVYGQGGGRTLAKLAFIACFYFLFAVLTLAATSIYSALSL